jgi:predicted ester cyclase
MGGDAIDLAHKWVNVFNQGDPDLWDEIVAPDAIDHGPLPGQTPGIEGFKERGRMLIAAIGDRTSGVEDAFASGDRLCFRWYMRGTHVGPLLGVEPTGRQLDMQGINIEKIIDGKVAEHWSFPDLLSVMRQISG